MKKTIIITATLIFLSSLFAFTFITPRTVSSSTVAFAIKNAGITVDGTLGNLKTSVFNFDVNDLANSQINATVDVSSINTGIDKRDEHLKNEDYFNVAKYSTIKMSSIRFAKSTGTYTIGYFNLTIKDVTKEVAIPIYITLEDGKNKFRTSFKINRLDYGVGESGFILSDDVKIAITAFTN